jgi:S-formylglutathione hydrolase FrmB
VAIKRTDWPNGRIVTVEHTSRVLADNPLGDPHVRLLDVWLPPQYDRAKGRGRGARFPVVYDLVGFTGTGRMHTAPRSFEENVPERAARLVHERKMGPMIVAFPDCFTALGGNQYVNSTAIGRYADYLTRELVPFVDKEFRTLASREHRGCFGKSSGGYGAIVHGMKYSRSWGAVACHSGDSYFDWVYGADWPNTLDELAKFRRPKRKPGKVDVVAAAKKAGYDGRDDGRIGRFLNHVWGKTKLGDGEVHALMNLAMAATYDPDPKAPNGFRVPFNLETGEVLPERWRRWLEHDPVHLVARYAKELRTLRGIFVDCGWRDQYRIHYGSRLLSKALAEHRVAHVYEEFDDNHSGIDYRMERSLPFLYKALR